MLTLNEQLLEAAKNGDLNKVQQSVGQGADVNYADDYGWTPICEAGYCNNPEILKYLEKIKNQQQGRYSSEAPSPMLNGGLDKVVSSGQSNQGSCLTM